MSANMLKELKFVQGSVAKKDLLPALTHFRIEGGQVRGYNGMIAICTPIPFDIDCTPKAEPLIKAIQACEETIQLSMTKAGRLAIRSGDFTAYVECVEGETAHVMPEGEMIDVDGEALMRAFRTLQPFIGDDASRAFSNGVLLDNQSAYATNNVMAVEYWVGAPFPVRINVPRQAIKELLRIGEAPVACQCSENSITFHYSGDRWVRTQLLESQWPDMGRILNQQCNPVAIDERIFTGAAKLKHACDNIGRIYFTDAGLRTHMDDGLGNAYNIEGFDLPGVYNVEMLLLMKGVATKADWSRYPAPAMFFGDQLRGAIIGMRGDVGKVAGSEDTDNGAE